MPEGGKRCRPPVESGIRVGGSNSGQKPRLQLPVTLEMLQITHSCTALLDSGSEQNLISLDLAERLGVPLVRLEPPIPVRAINNQVFTKISFHTGPVSLCTSGNHREKLTFFVLDSPDTPLTLGYPWLCLHNPHLDWEGQRVVSWSPFCHSNCLTSARFPGPGEATGTDEYVPDLSGVPPEYHDLREVFSKIKAQSLPPHRPYDCAIDLLPGASLPKSRLYSISRPERAAMEEYIRDSLAAGLIRPSSSPVAAGFFFVDKKDGSLRPCIDFRGLNDVTIKNKYPLPLISSAVESLQGATVFTKLDLRNAYHLVRIRQGDEWKTAFNTPLGHFEYLVMPFGLTNAPAVFQALINDVLRDFLDRFVFVYLDDILIFSKTLAEHHSHVRAVLQRLLENRLYAKAEKCEFHLTSVSFLGYILAGGQVKTDPAKVKAVTDWPVPSTRKQLQGFLGFANFYRRFIRNYSLVAAPLTRLTSTKLPFGWSAEADSAFTKLKHLFSTAPILAQPDPSKAFIVEVDASDVGVGAVLSQRAGPSSKLRPCAFFSRRLSPAERNYDVGDRELLAVKLALEEWRHHLEGAALPFLVWTDHKNLTYLRGAKRLNARQARWSLFFARFNFSISYRPGSRNTKPDALSRQFDSDTGPAEFSTILPAGCTVGAITWEVEDAINRGLRTEPDPGTGPTNRRFVPAAARSKVLEWVHASRFACHPGRGRTTSMVKRHFWWATLDKDVREYVAACPVCARCKSRTHRPAGLLQPLSTPHRPWSHIALDFVTGLPVSAGKTTILSVVDRFSKAAHFVALEKLPTAAETSTLLLDHVFRLHGIPVEIVSDRGPQFSSQVWGSFCAALGARPCLSSGYHPQTNGQTERLNQELEAALRCVTCHNPATWASYLPWVEYAHNSLVSSATGLSPFEASLGYQPPLFPEEEADLAVPSVQHHLQRCRRVWSRTREALLRAVARQRSCADRRRSPAPVYSPGQKVWLAAKDIPLRASSRKLSPRYIGPYSVDRVLSPTAVKLRLPAALRVHPVFHVSQVKPVVSSRLCPPPVPPPPARLIDGHPAFSVRRILDVRRRGRGLQFLVDWEGYGPEERSWVPRSLMLDSVMVSDFLRSRRGAGAGRPPGGVP